MNRFGKRSALQKAALSTLCISALGLFACATPKPVAPPPPPPPAPETPADVEHQVSYNGETLGMIASWYTGSASNWKGIVEANPGLRPERLRLGQTIMIPSHLVTQREPMPKRFVSDLLAKTRRNQPALAEPPAADGTATLGTETLPGETPSDPSDVAPKKGAAVVDAGTIPDRIEQPPAGVVPPPSDPTSTKPPTPPEPPPAGSDTEREKLLDELLAQ